ncbi:MAG: hypothetical protein QHC90_16905 [Shinella sp.]|nr:hypothetical protein [Shinella sp.]
MSDGNHHVVTFAGVRQGYRSQGAGTAGGIAGAADISLIRAFLMGRLYQTLLFIPAAMAFFALMEVPCGGMNNSGILARMAAAVRVASPSENHDYFDSGEVSLTGAGAGW